MSSLLDIILRLPTVPKGLPAILDGIRMEPVVAQTCRQMQRKQHHRPLEVNECGLIVDTEHPYIDASPDRPVSCCCEEWVLEIKPSLKCHTAGEAPSPALLEYLV